MDTVTTLRVETFARRKIREIYETLQKKKFRVYQNNCAVWKKLWRKEMKTIFNNEMKIY